MDDLDEEDDDDVNLVTENPGLNSLVNIDKRFQSIESYANVEDVESRSGGMSFNMSEK